MNLGQMIRLFRVQSNDKVEPYFHEDEDVKLWLNQAIDEACIRGRLIHEFLNPDVCSIAVSVGNSNYKLHDSIYELTKVTFLKSENSTHDNIRLVSEEFLNLYYHGDWSNLNGIPEFAIQSDTSIRLVPIPNISGTLSIEGYRTQITELDDDLDNPADINRLHHAHLVEWALHKAFSIPDTEFFDPNRSAIALGNFSNYFGDRPDSDLRRQTREDAPHVVKPFLP